MINMFIHNFKYSLKVLLNSKMLIFWTFAFPLILGTLFKMAFASIEDNEKLDIIDIAIINNEEFRNNEIFKRSFEELSSKNNKERLFNTKYVEKDKALELLDNKKIVGYLELRDNKPILIFKNNGINESVFKYVTEEIVETSSMINTISEDVISNEINNGNYNIDYEKIYLDVASLIKKESSNIKNISNNNLSYTMIEFYTLIAMTCLYGGMLSMVSINQCLANMSNKGKRVSVSPTKKRTTILSSLLSSYLVQLIGLLILFLYTIFVLKVDYGDNIFLVVLLSIVGSLAGLSLGTFVGSVFKTNENAKTGILISFTMFGCFLSGMMGITMKYIVDKNIPILNLINPASMITDGLYSLYYYDTLNRYYFNIISLLLFSLILIIISIINLRRQKYDSI